MRWTWEVIPFLFVGVSWFIVGMGVGIWLVLSGHITKKDRVEILKP